MRTCLNCPFHVAKKFTVHGETAFGHYCAHPAYIESFGIEQYLKTNGAAGIIPFDCILDEPIAPWAIWAAVMQNRLFWERCEMDGPVLSRASQLHPDHASWLKGEL